MTLRLPDGRLIPDRERTHPVFVWRCDRCGLIYCSAGAAKAECWHGNCSFMSEYLISPVMQCGTCLIHTGGRRLRYSADLDHRRKYCGPTVG